jgi:hypothetical protein
MPASHPAMASPNHIPPVRSTDVFLPVRVETAPGIDADPVPCGLSSNDAMRVVGSGGASGWAFAMDDGAGGAADVIRPAQGTTRTDDVD